MDGKKRSALVLRWASYCTHSFMMVQCVTRDLVAELISCQWWSTCLHTPKMIINFIHYSCMCPLTQRRKPQHALYEFLSDHFAHKDINNSDANPFVTEGFPHHTSFPPSELLGERERCIPFVSKTRARFASLHTPHSSIHCRALAST